MEHAHAAFPGGVALRANVANVPREALVKMWTIPSSEARPSRHERIQGCRERSKNIAWDSNMRA
jgi:hypothetical protein